MFAELVGCAQYWTCRNAHGISRSAPQQEVPDDPAAPQAPNLTPMQLGYASAPIPPLNDAIALSILFLGPEIVRKWHGQTSFTIRHPWVVAFAFGLLHGFGFATGLTTMGLPQAEIPLALLLFNVGVEIGQVFFVAAIVALERLQDARDSLAASCRSASRLRGRVVRRLLDHSAHSARWWAST